MYEREQGKTTTTERMLYDSGLTRHLGSKYIIHMPGVALHAARGYSGCMAVGDEP